jgi:hypothetical protein
MPGLVKLFCAPQRWVSAAETALETVIEQLVLPDAW